MTQAILDAWVRRIPALIALLSVFALIASVLHEWAYFSVIGPQYQALLTSTDYLAHAIFWLPLAALILLAWFALSMLANKFGNYLDSEERHYKVRRRSMVAIGLTIVILMPALVVVMLSTGSKLMIGAVSFTLIVESAWVLLIWRQSPKAQMSFAVMFSVMIPFIIMSTGNMRAIFDMASLDPVFRIVLKTLIQLMACCFGHLIVGSFYTCRRTSA